MKILSVLIALVLLYAVISLLVSTIVEAISHKLKLRGKMLKKAILQMLDDPENKQYGALLLEHRMVSIMGSKENGRPAQYLDKNVFSEALIDIIGQQAEVGFPISTDSTDASKKEFKTSETEKEFSALDAFKEGVKEMNQSEFKGIMQSMYSKADGDYEKLKKLMEDWYNNYMDRVSGWYKTGQRSYFRIVGFAVALFLNVDTFQVFKVISIDDELRLELNDIADNVVVDYAQLSAEEKQSANKLIQIVRNTVVADTTENMAPTTDKEQLMQISKKQLEKLIAKHDSTSSHTIKQLKNVASLTEEMGFPIGWSKKEAPLAWFYRGCQKPEVTQAATSSLTSLHAKRNKPSFKTVSIYLFGLLISGFALSFGAPFWFDTLSKLVTMRNSGKKPKKT